MRKDSRYYIETDFGCGIRQAQNLRQAKSNLRREVGEMSSLFSVRLATKADLNWVHGMSGKVE